MSATCMVLTMYSWSCTDVALYDFLHTFTTHMYDRCIIVAELEFFLLRGSHGTTCSFCCWLRHYDRKNDEITIRDVIHTFDSLSSDIYTSKQIARCRWHVRVLYMYSALSVRALSRWIAGRGPDCRGAVT